MIANAMDLSSRPGGRHPLRGSVLLPVLAVLAAVAGLVLHMQVRASTAMRHAESLAIMTHLRVAAADTAWMMVQQLADAEREEGVHFGQAWAEPLEMTRADGIRVAARMHDEQAGFDVNNLAVELTDAGTRRPDLVLIDILRACGDEEAVERVRILRGTVTTREFAAGNDDGEDLQGRVQRPLLSMGELASVRGWGRDVLSRPLPGREGQDATDQIGSVLTVGPGTGHRLAPVNLNTAPREVLLGLLGEERALMVDVLLDLREKTPLPSLAALRAVVPDHVLGPLSEYVDVRSTRFRVEVVAEHRGRQAQLTAWAERDPAGEVHITGWVE